MPALNTPRSAAEILRHFEEVAPITKHPFFERFRSEPANLRHLWRLLANFQISISKNFARRLATITGRVDDERVRCILAEQLNDELGGGKFERAHVNLFAAMMKELEPWKPEVIDEPVLAPGRNLDRRLAEIYGAADLNSALGAVIVGEVFGEQMDKRLADEFRRQDQLDINRLEWLTLHEQLEVEHADSSTVLAEMLPTTAIESIWSGGQALARAGGDFLTELYALCYGSG